MRVLVFDTETTGLLPPKNEALSKYPFIVQLSWIVYDFGTNKIVSIEDHIVKLPEFIEIPTNATKIHGITNKKMKKLGRDIKEVLFKFVSDIKTCTTLIAHNINFDRRVINVELMRNGFSKSLGELRRKEYCTMKKGTDICKLTMKSYYSTKRIPKFPRLTELHDKLFKTSPKNIHNALIDILMCFRCYYKMTQTFDIMNVNPEFDRFYKETCKM
jgi:DNA polymerase III epsilon subunit-like protein